jgi:mono/diheme cytochrome c family protein
MGSGETSNKKGLEMRRGYFTVAGLLLFGAFACGASAQESAYSGSAGAGRELALHNCDACHIVAPNQDLRPLVSGYAPSFIDIANRPTTSEESLRVFLSHPHAYANMPYPDLAARDLTNVVAYILSLRGRH